MKQLVALPNVLGVKSCAGYHGCQVNELISLHERHLKPTKPVDYQAMSIYMRAFAQFTKHYPIKQFKPLSREETINESPQNRRRRIRNAYDSIDKHGGFPPGYERVKAFLKWEKYEDDIFDPLEAKAPRMIQHRSDEYCYELARYIKPLEKYVLYRRDGRYCKKRHRIFIKGMNSFEIADNLVHMGDRFADPVYVPLDHSKYDAHLNFGLRGMFRKWMKLCYKNNQHFKDMVDKQAKNRCMTANEILYEMEETLCSGEILTSFEGSSTNYAVALEFTRHVVAEIRCNGDDMVICLDRSQLHLLDWDFFEKACLTTKLSVVYDIADVEFCQCRVVEIKPGLYRMVRSPARVIARTCYTVKNFPNESGWLKLLGAVGQGELSCNAGVPVLQSWANLLIRSSLGEFSEALYSEYMMRRCERKMKSMPIEDCARRSFWLAYGITPNKQRELERFFDNKERLVVLAQAGN